MHWNPTANKKVSELYPEVTRITLFVAFEEADAEAEPNYQQIIFTPESDAAFFLDCSRENCAGGGFDYAPFIAALIERGEQRGHDRLVCAGRLDGAAGQTPCGLQSEYRIIIQ